MRVQSRDRQGAVGTVIHGSRPGQSRRPADFLQLFAACPIQNHGGREHNVKRTASAQWRGDLKNGAGSVSTASGVLENSQYSFGTRFENGKGTNPEELLAAAHAGCFTMALSAQLGQGRTWSP